MPGSPSALQRHSEILLKQPLMIRPARGTRPSPNERGMDMLGIAAAVLFFIAFLISAATISTNEVFSSTNFMLIGLAALALHVAGIGHGWVAGGRGRGRGRRS